jgi:hypothetical protein
LYYVKLYYRWIQFLGYDLVGDSIDRKLLAKRCLEIVKDAERGGTAVNWLVCDMSAANVAAYREIGGSSRKSNIVYKVNLFCTFDAQLLYILRIIFQ